MAKFIEIPASKESYYRRKKLYGIGVNDADYCISYKKDGKNIMCPFYDKWKAMLKRCYSEKWKEKYPWYIGCVVSKDWHTFTVFKKWMKEQDWENKELDKDILVQGNKIYSKSTCIFVSSQVNNLLNDGASRRGDLPLGVSKDGKKFYACCKNRGKTINLGRYDTVSEASLVYSRYKYHLIVDIANEQKKQVAEKCFIEKCQ